MNKFCPNCGKPVKEKDNICENCSYRLKQTPVNKPVSRMETVNSNTIPSSPKKSNPWPVIFAVVVGLLIAGGVGYWAFNYFYGVNNTASTTEKSSTATTSSMSQDNKRTSKYNNEEWMLMGYLAYKNKSIGNVDSTINSIASDFNKGDLLARKNSADSYTLSNQYGSVDVQVNEDDVVVTNDGTTRTSKENLEKMFSGKNNQISSMTKYLNFKISDYHSSNNWQIGIPANVVGEYTNYRDESEQNHRAQNAVCDIRPSTIVSWSSGMATSYATNVQYRKLGENKYEFKFDVRVVGNIIADHSKKLPNGTPYQDGVGTLSFEKIGSKTYIINGNKFYKQSSTNFHLPSTPEN